MQVRLGLNATAAITVHVLRQFGTELEFFYQSTGTSANAVGAISVALPNIFSLNISLPAKHFTNTSEKSSAGVQTKTKLLVSAPSFLPHESD